MQKTLKLRLTGKDGVPLMVHNNQMVNPLNRYARALKPITSKRNKTDKDVSDIARIEWEAGFYIGDNKAGLPAENIYACFWEGAKLNKLGKLFKQGVRSVDIFCPFIEPVIEVEKSEIIPNTSLDKYYEDHLDLRVVKVKRQAVLRARPIFKKWSLDYTLEYMENHINKVTLLKIIQVASDFIGLGEKRPELGIFNTEIIEK